MNTKEIRKEMETLGFEFEEESPYPVESDIPKFIALQTLMREWVKSLIQEGHLSPTNLAVSHVWLSEASEEWLLG